ncbi:MAG: iron-containing alcohol dehydrogenase [Deltaproteobacteria bacterium]|nr:iron-containing alcohol dehydrogenase [Deltaproteobacteria bacterium]
MQNFVFENPTKIIFGKGQIPKIGKETFRFGKKALLVYGMGSIYKNGIYDQVTDSLKKAGVGCIDFPGVKSNPVLSHVQKGIELARHEKADVIVAVGGGSVIDAAKTISAGVNANHDVWDFFTFSKTITGALPVLTVVTVSASASEMNAGAVVTNEDGCRKYCIVSPFIQPKVSILDPTVLFSLSPEYSAYSAVDVITHMLEGYFNNTASASPLQDRLVESLMKTVMESTDIIMKEPDNYNARANMMWSAILGFNGLTTAGLGKVIMPAHMIEHSLSAIYNIAHGAGLSIVTPAWMSWALDTKEERLAKFAREIFQVKGARLRLAAEKGIACLKLWFESIGSPVSLKAVNIPESDIEAIAQNAFALSQVWRYDGYTKDVITQILSNAC